MQSSPKTVHIHYFALMREERGLASETFSTCAQSVQELFDELNQKFGFSLSVERLRVSINDQFENWNSTINENDRIVFIPPVAGG